MSKREPFGYCDRSGFRYPIKELVEQWENQKPTGLLVGKDMLDIDHEQLRIGEVESNDKQSLDNPRLDQNMTQSRAIFSFDPVGLGGLNMSMTPSRVSTA